MIEKFFYGLYNFFFDEHINVVNNGLIIIGSFDEESDSIGSDDLLC